MAINWGLGVMPDIGGNALAMFERGREMKREDDTRNALSAYATNPNEQTLAPVMAADPRLGIQLRGQQQQQETQSAALRTRAAQGDATAMSQLIGVDFDAWKSLSGEQRQSIKAQNEYVGNAALDISRLAPEQQAAAWDSYIQQGSQQYPALAEYQGKYSPQALQSALASSGMMKQFIDMTDPKYQVIPEGGTLVNTNDPAAVRSFVGDQAPQQAKAPVRVTSPAEARNLPPGTRFIDPNGVERMVPGGGSGNATGSFRP